MEEHAEALIDEIKHKVRAAYVMHRKRAQCIENFTPGEEKWGKYFYKAAKLCVKHSMDPYEFVEVQFAECKPWPSIPSLSTAAAVTRFMEGRKANMEMVTYKFTSQLRVYEKLLNQGHSILETLYEMRQEFDPLFVYSALVVNGLYAEAEKWKDSALLKYMSSVHYQKLYSDTLPKDMIELAEEMKRRAG
jgi:hypothetical protein